MKYTSFFYILLISLPLIYSCGDDEQPPVVTTPLQLTALRVGPQTLSVSGENTGVATDLPLIVEFSSALELAEAEQFFTLEKDGQIISVTASRQADNSYSLSPSADLAFNTTYTFTILEFTTDRRQTFPGAAFMFTTEAGEITLESATVNNQALRANISVNNVNPDINISLTFSDAITGDQLADEIRLIKGSGGPSSDLQLTLSEDKRSISVEANLPPASYESYLLSIGSGIAPEGQSFDPTTLRFRLALDSTLKFPEIPDEELLTKVQEQTFKYFWDFAHPVSGLTRERNTSGETVTIGGSGFGIMAIPVAVHRGFITRQEGVDRLEKIVTFLHNKADRFHGVFPHWLNGTTGATQPFSPQDNGGDIVETAFMIQALITVRQYLDGGTEQENNINTFINNIISEVEWDWHTQGGQDLIFWHWSPDFEWAINLPVRGWNESLMVYLLGAASDTHGIEKSVYDNGWARNGDMRNTTGATYYDLQLPLRTDRGGPLFFAHYSFLGLDPRNLSDQYADYWEQNRTHTLMNRAYCIANPQNHIGYASYSWGLTASDGNEGYFAHSPDDDRGVITPTAAIGSIPYTPEESLAAIRHFYYILGDKLWGEYGFYDAFNPGAGWYADSYLAIDQGPIICMIENHRSGLLWDLFMSSAEAKRGLDKLEFTY